MSLYKFTKLSFKGGKFVLFTLSGLKVKVGGFRVMFVKVHEWFVGCDRLKIIFKSKKTRLPNCPLF